MVKGLGIRLGQWGFSQEEADHQGVCVQEPPRSAKVAKESPNSAVAESYSEYNQRRCRGQSNLDKCFGIDSEVRYGTLSHSHLLLVLLSWLNGAQWGLTDEEKKAVVVDQHGRLDLSAAVAAENLVELHKACQEGLTMEVLAWQINVEEPGACSLISRALNMGTELALRTTELTALSVLSGECALQCRISGSDTISFEAVKAAVRKQLDCFVDESEFTEVFDFVINLGAGSNPFVPDLIDFGARFVDQKKRQLRLHAFTEINKVAAHFPRTKIAALKRAYRKKPCHGFCPAPETKFHTAPCAITNKLEELLHYFHVYRKTAVAALGGEHQQTAFLANVDCAAAEAFINCSDKDSEKEVKEKLLAATAKYHEQLVTTVPQELHPEVSDARLRWIEFPMENQQAGAAVAVATKKMLPKVIIFDEVTGQALTSQEQQRCETKGPSSEHLSLPWRQWHSSDLGKHLGQQDSAMRAALHVLYMLHARQEYASLPIDILLNETKNHRLVMATETMSPESIMLPPCVPKSAKLSVDSVHPHRVPIQVTVILGTAPVQPAVAVEVSAVAGSAEKSNEKAQGVEKKRRKASSAEAARPAVAVSQRTVFVFYALPEWKGPERALEDDQSEWVWTGDESMHPFWAIRRVSGEKTKEGCLNCGYKEVNFTDVVVGALDGKSTSLTTEVSVPFLTNTIAIPKGAELVLEVEEATSAPKKQWTWKNEVHNDPKNKQAKPAQNSAKAQRTTEI